MARGAPEDSLTGSADRNLEATRAYFEGRDALWTAVIYIQYTQLEGLVKTWVFSYIGTSLHLRRQERRLGRSVHLFVCFEWEFQ